VDGEAIGILGNRLGWEDLLRPLHVALPHFGVVELALVLANRVCSGYQHHFRDRESFLLFRRATLPQNEDPLPGLATSYHCNRVYSWPGPSPKGPV